MSNILLKVENAGAERLWNYLLAYRRMIGKTNFNVESSKSNIIFGLVSAPERIKVTTKHQKSNRKHK